MQKTFIFSKQFGKTYPKKYIPGRHFTIKDEFIASILKKGYVLKDLVIEETITIKCFGAKANVSRSERRKLQNKIDKMPSGAFNKLIIN